MYIKKIKAEDTWGIRHKVMWPTKDIDYVKLEDDHKGIHYGVIEDDQIFSVISLFIKGNRAQFRKFATLKDRQGKGYGSKLLGFVIDEAIKLGVSYLWCNAREEKIDFYKKFGMVDTDDRFIKGGRKYIIMEKFLL